MELVNIKYTGNVKQLKEYRQNILIVTDSEGNVYPMTYTPQSGSDCGYDADGYNQDDFSCEWKYVTYKDEDDDENHVTLRNIHVESIHVIK